jgi:hypothetical protein
MYMAPGDPPEVCGPVATTLIIAGPQILVKQSHLNRGDEMSPQTGLFNVTYPAGYQVSERCAIHARPCGVAPGRPELAIRW